MPKIISKETHDEILRLHFEEGLPFSEISKRLPVGRAKVAEICWEEEARRADQAMKEDREKEREESAHKRESEAFAKFEDGKNPVNLVEEGFCSADEARELWKKYVDLRNEARPALEILEARMENASHLVRCALGHAKTEINCPVCHKWTYLTLQKVDGEQRWACENCGKIPF